MQNQGKQGLSLGQKVLVASGIFLVALACLTIAKSASRGSQQNTSSRLELTRKRFEMCETERRLLQSDKEFQVDELRMAEEEYASLKSENSLLREDNEELSTDIAELEKFVDDLREEFDEKDFISDDEAEALEETLALGNNSAELSELLNSAQYFREEGNEIVVGKDELITSVLNELKVKTRSLLACMGEKKLVGKIDPGLLWDELTQVQKRAMLKAVIKRIVTAKAIDFMESEELLTKWGPRHPFGMEGLKDDVDKQTKERERIALTKENGQAGDRNQQDMADFEGMEDKPASSFEAEDWAFWNEDEDLQDE